MITSAPKTPASKPPNGRTPPLQNGDWLTAAEFERRYEQMPNVKKAELIDGVVYMPSPVKHENHSRPHILIATWLGTYMSETPGVDGGDNGTLRLDIGSQPQPDCFLRLLPEYGGQTEIDADGYIAGGPELIIEVSATSASYDCNQKLGVYRKHRVKEYVIWRVLDEAVDWFVLRGGEYVLLQMSDGVYRSEIFQGLWLDAQALVAGDIRRVLEVLRNGMNSR